MKILITILGRGQFNKEINDYDYSLTKYQIENNEPIESKLVGDILNKIEQFDKIYVIGTNESLWNVADEYIKDYEKIIIPYGTNYDEFWDMFEVFTKLDINSGSEIYFDVTHGFRSIPIFLSTILNFFIKVKGATIKGVYYGIFEAKQNNITPVINMLPLLEMNSFIDSFSIFHKYSDGRDIAGIINEKFKHIPNDDKKKFGSLSSLSKELDFYSKTIGLSSVKFYIDSLQKMSKIIDKIDNIPSNLKAINFLLENIKQELDIFNNIDKEWEKFLMTAKLLYEKNRYAQSLTVLRETLITYILEELNLDILDKDLREGRLNVLFKADNNLINNKEESIYFTKNFIQLTQQIKELRNKVNHAFLSKNVGEKDIRKSVMNLELFIDNFENLIENKNIFKNEDLVHKTLTKCIRFKDLEPILIEQGKSAKRKSWKENVVVFVKYSYISLAIKNLDTGEFKKYIPTEDDLEACDWILCN